MLRPAEGGDVEATREWRNQDVNRDASINSHVVSAEAPCVVASGCARARSGGAVFESGGRSLGVVKFFDIELGTASQLPTAWGFFLDSAPTTGEGMAMTAWMQGKKDA